MLGLLETRLLTPVMHPIWSIVACLPAVHACLKVL